MDLLATPPSLDLNDRSWVIHTRSEERPPVKIEQGAIVEDSMITDGSIICAGARVVRSVLSPGVYVGPGAYVFESVILTDSYIERKRGRRAAVIDKGVVVGQGARIGRARRAGRVRHCLVGKKRRPRALYHANSAYIGSDLVADEIIEHTRTA